ncbi:hypothetical protein BLA29_012319 [Euroglyphus maynei]|uniref:Uncharacterized protein n=1 Tax=Euroglyphus maynei TaxID=6958 RepID=A0A1Y3B409_EURMA|nr:hypothetical protein BLA29_012319 [Euroglyphus maynei]
MMARAVPFKNHNPKMNHISSDTQLPNQSSKKFTKSLLHNDELPKKSNQFRYVFASQSNV